MNISFCTTSANRTPQLRAVWAANLQSIASDPELDWVIVNFGSSDDLDSFMDGSLARMPPRITYAREHSRRAWHMSIAKNVAHRLGSGDILASLDCDNLIGNAAEAIRRHFSDGADAVHMWSGIRGDGTCGRIAIKREDFESLGGYDEAFHPVTYEDIDLLRRAAAAGLHVVRAPCSPKLAIKNTPEESLRYCRRGACLGTSSIASIALNPWPISRRDD